MRFWEWITRLFAARSQTGQAPVLPTSPPQSPSSSASAPSTPAPEAVSSPKSAGTPEPLRILDAGLKWKHSRAPITPPLVRFVVIHHTSNSNPRWGVNECHASHQAPPRNWNGIGYHYFVEQSGTIYYGRADAQRDYIGAHVEGYNSRSVGICLDGHYSVQTPSESNLDIVARLTAMLLKRYRLSVADIRYHSELDSKDCPGRNFPSRAEFARRVAKIIDNSA